MYISYICIRVPCACFWTCVFVSLCVFFSFCPVAPLAWRVSSVIPCPWATDQSSRADSPPAGAGLIKEPPTDPGSVIKTCIHLDNGEPFLIKVVSLL